SGSRVLPGSPVTFTGTALDAENGDLSAQIAWSSDRDGALGTGASLGVTTLTPGRHTITARVTDAGGVSGQAQITLDGLHPPAGTVAAPAAGATVFTTAFPVTLQGQATDAEDGVLTPRLAWSSDRDGALGTGGTIAVPTLSVGLHTITATVTDADGLTTSVRR